MRGVTLKQAAEQWAKENPEYSTQKGALNQCDWASREFIKWLRLNHPRLAEYHKVREYSFYLTEAERRKFEPIEPITVSRSRSNPDPATYSGRFNESGDEISPWHVIVETRSHFIDFTAKQYKSAAAYPYVMRKQNLVATAAAGAA